MIEIVLNTTIIDVISSDDDAINSVICTNGQTTQLNQLGKFIPESTPGKKNFEDAIRYCVLTNFQFTGKEREMKRRVTEFYLRVVAP